MQSQTNTIYTTGYFCYRRLVRRIENAKATVDELKAINVFDYKGTFTIGLSERSFILKKIHKIALIYKALTCNASIYSKTSIIRITWSTCNTVYSVAPSCIIYPQVWQENTDLKLYTKTWRHSSAFWMMVFKAHFSPFILIEKSN
jgi:hypothetical protein